jgi:hypothetical protein
MSVSRSFTAEGVTFQPAYLKLGKSGELLRRVELGLAKLASAPSARATATSTASKMKPRYVRPAVTLL